MTRWAREGGSRCRRICSVASLLLVILCLMTTSGPAMVRGQEATAPALATAGGLPALLALVPATFPEVTADQRDAVFVSYAEIAAQLSAVGVEPPLNPDDAAAVDRFALATSGLALPYHAATKLRDGDLRAWRDTFGFDLSQVDQSLQVDAAAAGLTLYRGRFDQVELRSAWERAGYKPLDIDGVTVMAVGDDYELNLRSPVGRLALQYMNYLVVLADGTLLAAPSRGIVEAVLDVAAGQAPSMRDRADVASLLAQAPTDLASAMLLSGSQLAASDRDGEATPPAAQASLPPIELALLAVTVGGPLRTFAPAATPVPLPPGAPTARFVLALLLSSPEDAAAASPVITERLATGVSSWQDRPFAALFPEQSVRAVRGEPVVVVELAYGAATPSGIWLRLLNERGLEFVAW